MSGSRDEGVDLRSIFALDDEALAQAAAREVGRFLDVDFIADHSDARTSAADESLVPAWFRDAIPGYEPVREIGRGGMGVVVEAIESMTGRTVAIKIPHAHLQGPSMRSRLRVEAAALARVKHEHVAQLFGVVEGAGALRGSIALVMERVNGMPFGEWLATSPPLRAKIEAVRGLADALDAAHRVGVLHLDLKPSNVLIDRAGRPKVLDFGIAHLVQEIGDGTLTLVTHGFGTIEAMSPEQIDARMASPASDVYGIGTLLYMALSGRAPLELSGLPISEAARRVREETPARLRTARSGVPRDLEVIAFTSLAKEVRDRYPSAGAVRDDLDRWLTGRPILARRATLWVRGSRFLARHRAGAAATIAIGALLLAGLGATTSQWLRAHDAELRAQIERDRALARFDEARRFTNWVIFDLTDRLAALPGTSAVRTRLIEQASMTLQELSLDPDAPVELSLDLAAAHLRVNEIIENERGVQEGEARLLLVDSILDRPGVGDTARGGALRAWTMLRSMWRANDDSPEEKVLLCEKAIEFLDHAIRSEPSTAEYFRWRSEVRIFLSRRLIQIEAPRDEIIIVLERAIKDADRAALLAPFDAFCQAQTANARFWLVHAHAELGGRPASLFDDSVERAIELQRRGHRQGLYFVSRARAERARTFAQSRGADWFLSEARLAIREADQAVEFEPDNKVPARNAETTRARLAYAALGLLSSGREDVRAEAREWTLEATRLLESRVARGWASALEVEQYPLRLAYLLSRFETPSVADEVEGR